TTATGNSATGGAGPTPGQGIGGILYDLNGVVTAQDSTLSGASNTAATTANSLYIQSSNAGITFVGGFTPFAILVQSNIVLAGSDVSISQLAGTVTTQTSTL